MAAPTSPAPAAPGGEHPAGSGPPRVHRRRSGGVVAGVAGGVADHLELPVDRVRLAFALLAGLGGAGVVAYGALWIWCPPEPADAPERPAVPGERRRAVGLIALGIAFAAVVGGVGNQAGVALGPLVVALLGVGLVWREADPAARRRARPAAARRTPWSVARIAVGVVLVVAGIVGVLLPRIGLGQVSFAVLAVVVTLAGLAVLTLPWAVGFAREYAAERRERIRASERAEIAAHLHDSVLQTLALIQRHTEDPDADPQRAATEVRRLARRQERELRAWLYAAGPGPARADRDGAAPEDPGGDEPARGTFAAVLGAAAAEVEDTFAVTAAPVVVGDGPLDDGLAALVAAVREALVNAAKHAGVTEVSVYAEVEPTLVSVFVRDRGCGFDPAAVAPDRHGLADSVRGRVERHGGRVDVRSTPGEGTEVALRMPRSTPGTRTATGAGEIR